MLSKTKALVAPLGDRGEMSIGKRAKNMSARLGVARVIMISPPSVQWSRGRGGGNTLPQPGLPALSRS